MTTQNRNTNRTPQQWLEYKQLEQIPLTIAETQDLSPQTAGKFHRLSRWPERIWRSIARLLESTTDPRVWKTYDQKGNPIWHAHDPLTGQESEWICEEDVRVWLEQRYYQPGQQLPLTPQEQR